VVRKGEGSDLELPSLFDHQQHQLSRARASAACKPEIGEHVRQPAYPLDPHVV
jgi:hypothetical protein